MSTTNARRTLLRIRLEIGNPGLSPERLLGFLDKIEAELPPEPDAPDVVRTPAGLPVCRGRFHGHLTVFDGGLQ